MKEKLMEDLKMAMKNKDIVKKWWKDHYDVDIA